MKTIIITGTSRGIGRAAAEAFLAAGDFVIGTKLSGESGISHENFRELSLDLRAENSIAACAAEIAGMGKKIDVLVNNAGVLLDEDEEKVVPEKLRETLEVNVIGTTAFTEQIILLMDHGSRIINISSSAGSLGLPITHDHYPYHYPAYKISKAALNMYTKTLAGRLADGGIVVASLHPGWVKTEMGGEEASRTVEEAAADIIALATRESFESGQFWFKGEKYSW